ncbi:hypothetical protein BaRGS_00014244 [Batillaria attramentaria]|uniref:Uncharacterized protein n=1 Tax=Batillaria attramentaria TaxID=370345 RepID=A0ABD0L4X5_9CAEN
MFSGPPPCSHCFRVSLCWFRVHTTSMCILLPRAYFFRIHSSAFMCIPSASLFPLLQYPYCFHVPTVCSHCFHAGRVYTLRNTTQPPPPPPPRPFLLRSDKEMGRQVKCICNKGIRQGADVGRRRTRESHFTLNVAATFAAPSSPEAHRSLSCLTPLILYTNTGWAFAKQDVPSEVLLGLREQYHKKQEQSQAET